MVKVFEILKIVQLVTEHFLLFNVIRCNYLNSPYILTLSLVLVLFSSFKNLQLSSEFLKINLIIKENKIYSISAALIQRMLI